MARPTLWSVKKLVWPYKPVGLARMSRTLLSALAGSTGCTSFNSEVVEVSHPMTESRSMVVNVASDRGFANAREPRKVVSLPVA